MTEPRPMPTTPASAPLCPTCGAAALTALDRADVYRELEEVAETHEAYASLLEGGEVRAPDAPGAAASWRARALRCRALMAMFAEPVGGKGE